MLTLLDFHGLDGTMIIVEVLDEYHKCVVCVIDVGLVFPLEVLLLQ